MIFLEFGIELLTSMQLNIKSTAINTEAFEIFEK